MTLRLDFLLTFLDNRSMVSHLSFHKQEQIALGAILFLLFLHSLIAAFAGFFGVVYLICIGIVAACAFLYPRAGLLGLLITTIIFERFFTLAPLVIGESVYKLYPLDVVMGAVLLGTLFFFLKKESIFPSWHKSDSWLIAFLLLVTGIFIASLVWLSDIAPALAFSTWKQYAFYSLLVFLMPFLIRTWGDVKWFTKTLLVSALGVGFFLLLGIVLGGGLWTEYTPLTTSGVRLLAFPHGFYAALAFIITVLIFPVLVEIKKYKKGWLYFTGALFAVAVLASLMRHIWLSLIIVFGLLIVGTYRQGAGKKILQYFFLNALPIGALLIAIWFAVSLFPDSEGAFRSEKVVSVVSDRISSIGNPYDESLVWRKAVWQSAFEGFTASPLFGIGFGKYVPVELGDYQRYIEVRDMHNSWFALLIQTGIIGVLIFLIFLANLLWPLWKKRNKEEWFMPINIVLALLLFQALVFLSQPYLETNLLGIWFWVTLGFARAFHTLDRKNNQITGEVYADSRGE